MEEVTIGKKYTDMQLKRKIRVGEILSVTSERKKQLVAAGVTTETPVEETPVDLSSPQKTEEGLKESTVENSTDQPDLTKSTKEKTEKKVKSPAKAPVARRKFGANKK